MQDLLIYQKEWVFYLKKGKQPTSMFKKINVWLPKIRIWNVYKYYTKDQLKELGFDNSKQMSLMHLDISVLPYHIDKLTNLLNERKTNFKLKGITDSRLTTKKDEVNSIELFNYNIEHFPTKSDKGGPLLYMKIIKL